MRCIIDGKVRKIKFSGTVGNLLKNLDINRQTVLVKKEGRIVSELEPLTDTDSIEVITVVFGG
jgi:sulfur carrier protein ThiS